MDVPLWLGALKEGYANYAGIENAGGKLEFYADESYTELLGSFPINEEGTFVEKIQINPFWYYRIINEKGAIIRAGRVGVYTEEIETEPVDPDNPGQVIFTFSEFVMSFAEYPCGGYFINTIVMAQEGNYEVDYYYNSYLFRDAKYENNVLITPNKFYKRANLTTNVKEWTNAPTTFAFYSDVDPKGWAHITHYYPDTIPTDAVETDFPDWFNIDEYEANDSEWSRDYSTPLATWQSTEGAIRVQFNEIPIIATKFYDNGDPVNDYVNSYLIITLVYGTNLSTNEVINYYYNLYMNIRVTDVNSNLNRFIRIKNFNIVSNGSVDANISYYGLPTWVDPPAAFPFISAGGFPQVDVTGNTGIFYVTRDNTYFYFDIISKPNWFTIPYTVDYNNVVESWIEFIENPDAPPVEPPEEEPPYKFIFIEPYYHAGIENRGKNAYCDADFNANFEWTDLIELYNAVNFDGNKITNGIPIDRKGFMSYPLYAYGFYGWYGEYGASYGMVLSPTPYIPSEPDSSNSVVS
jgi:hypothetical protein